MLPIITPRATKHRALRDLIAGGAIGVDPPTPEPPPIDPPRPGEENYGPIIEDWIDDVVSRDSGRDFEFPREWPQVLRITPKSPGGRHMKWEGLTDKTIDMGGRLLVASESSLILRLDRMDGLTLRNGAFQGHGDVATTATWDAGLKLFRVDSDMPVGSSIYTIGTMPDEYLGGSLTDGQIYREVFVQDMTNHRGDPAKYGTYRLDGRSWVWVSGEVPPFVDGQRVTVQLQNNGGHCIVPNNEDHFRNVTFEDLSFVNVPGMIISGESDGNITIRNCQSRPKIGGLLASASDGFHFDNSRPGFLIEGCDMGRCNDDFVNLNAKWAYIEHLDQANKTVTVTAVPEMRGAINLGKFCDSAEGIVFCDRAGDGRAVDGGASMLHQSTSRSTESSKRHTFQLDSVTGLREGMLAVNRDRTSDGGTIRNNKFGGTRATGIKARGSKMKIHGNRINDCFGTAIRVDHHTDRGEGVFPREIEIYENDVFGCGRRDDNEFPKSAGDMPTPYHVDPNCELVSVRE